MDEPPVRTQGRWSAISRAGAIQVQLADEAGKAGSCCIFDRRFGAGLGRAVVVEISQPMFGNGCTGLLCPIEGGTSQGQQPAMMVVESKFGFDGLAPGAGGVF